MSNNAKSHAIILILAFLVSLVILPQITTKADSSNDSNIGCKVTAISLSGNASNVGTMTLNFTMNWTTNTAVPFIYVNMSYIIDNGSKVSIPVGNNPMFNSTAQGTYYHYEYVIFPPNAITTVCEVNISYLTDGLHKLYLFADGFYNLDNDFINPYDFSSSPIDFFINYPDITVTASPSPIPTTTPTSSLDSSPTTSPNSTLSPTSTLSLTPAPTVPEFPISTILILLILMMMACLLVYFKKHKGSKQFSQESLTNLSQETFTNTLLSITVY